MRAFDRSCLEAAGHQRGHSASRVMAAARRRCTSPCPQASKGAPHRLDERHVAFVERPHSRDETKARKASVLLYGFHVQSVSPLAQRRHVWKHQQLSACLPGEAAAQLHGWTCVANEHGALCAPATPRRFQSQSPAAAPLLGRKRAGQRAATSPLQGTPRQISLDRCVLVLVLLQWSARCLRWLCVRPSRAGPMCCSCTCSLASWLRPFGA